MSPEQQQIQNEFKKLMAELGALRAEMAHFRALLKGDTAALQALLKLAKEHSELIDAKWN